VAESAEEKVHTFVVAPIGCLPNAITPPR